MMGEGTIHSILELRAVNPSVIVGTSCTVDSAVYDSFIVSLGASYVNKSFDDYIFFQLNNGFYCLMFPDTVVHNGSVFSMGNIDTYVFAVDWDLEETSFNRSFSGSGSGSAAGSVGGAPAGYNFSDSFSGQYTDVYYENIPTYQVYHIFVDSYTLDCSSYLVYTSLVDSLPDMREGVLYYAFAGFVCFALVCCFKLFDRIFRRIS